MTIIKDDYDELMTSIYSKLESLTIQRLKQEKVITQRIRLKKEKSIFKSFLSSYRCFFWNYYKTDFNFY